MGCQRTPRQLPKAQKRGEAGEQTEEAVAAKLLRKANQQRVGQQHRTHKHEGKEVSVTLSCKSGASGNSSLVFIAQSAD
eukprot:6482416-Amphidinium_carterae.3